VRVANTSDIPALQALIARSGLAVSKGFYTDEQARAMTEHVYGVDSQLIADGTYFVIEDGDAIAACGGWSKRRTLFGGDHRKSGDDPLLDPRTEPARIRAFFVAPEYARRGLARQLLAACVAAATAAGFSTLELVSTAPGEPLYVASGFTVIERFEIDLPDSVRAPVALMRKKI